jgi:hypothetical protein
VIALDTAVLVYAVGGEHPLREQSRAVLAAIAAGSLEATTTPEVIEEFVQVRSRRTTRIEAVALGRQFAALLSPLVVTDAAALDGGLRAFAGSARLGAFDAVLAATGARDAAAIVSPDRAFAEQSLVRWVDLATPEVVDVLTSLRPS